MAPYKYAYLLLSLLAATQVQTKEDLPAGGATKLQTPDVLGAKTRILNLATGSLPVEHSMDKSFNDIQRQDVHVDGERAASMLEILRKEASPATWNKSTWQRALRMNDVIRPDDILKMDTGTLKDMISDGSLRGDTMKRSDQTRALNMQIMMSYGDPASWDVSVISDMVGSGILEKMDLGMLKKLNPSALVTELGKFKDLKFEDRLHKEILGNTLLKGLGGRLGVINITVEQLKSAGQFMTTRPTYLDNLPDDVLEGALKEMTETVQDDSQAANMVRRLMKMTLFQNPASLEAARLKEVGKVLPAFGKSTLRELNPAAVFGALATLNKVNFRPEDARILAQSMIEEGLIEPSSMDGAAVKNMGTLISGINSATLRDIPPGALRDGIDTVANVELKPAQSRVIIDKIKSGGALGHYAGSLGKLFKYISVSELTSSTLKDLDMTCNVTSGSMNHDVSRAQARVIIDIALRTIGTLDSDIRSYVMECAARWGKVMAIGFTSDLIRTLPNDAEIANLVEKLAPYDDVMEESEIREWVIKIKSALLSKPSEVDAVVIEQVGQFLWTLSNVELNQFPREVLPIVCRKLGEGSMIRTAVEDIRRLFTFCLKHVSIDGQIIDVTSAVSLKDDHIRDLGSLRCGLSQWQASRLTKEALMENLHHLANCTFDSRTGVALLENAKSKISDLLTTSDNLVMIAGLLHHLSATDIAAIDQVAMADAFVSIVQIIQERRAYLSYRQEALPVEQTVEDLRKEESGLTYLLMFGIEAMKASTDGDGRHKRAAGSMTCADIHLLGQALYVISLSEISSITGEEYEECAEILGSQGHWSADKLKVLAEKAKEAWGYNVSTWNVSNIAAAGSAIAGLPPADIAVLDLTDPDALFAISQYNLYSKEQTHAAFNNWLTSSDGNATNITGENLLTLGHFLCGASYQQLVEIDHDQYGDASDSIGKTYCFDESQLHALFTQAQSIAGDDVTTWTLSAMIVFGSVLAGISPADIGKLSVDQLGALVPDTVRIIPPSTFAGLTVEQLQSFSELQALAVTRDQQVQLSVEKMDALLGAGAKNLLAETEHDPEEMWIKMVLAPVLVLVFFLLVIILNLVTRQMAARKIEEEKKQITPGDRFKKL